MSRPPRPSYRIASNDEYPGVRVGAKVTYSLVRTNVVAVGDGRVADIAGTENEITREFPLLHPYTHDDVVHPRVLWALFAERAFELERVGETDGFGGGIAAGNYTVTVEWRKAGVHTIRCFIETPPPWAAGRAVVELRQEVLTPAADAEIAEELWTGSTFLGSLRGFAWLEPEEVRAQTQPERVAIEIFRALETYEQLEKRHPTRSPAASDAFEAIVRRQKRHASRLYELLLTTDAVAHQRYAVRTMHMGGVDARKLAVFIAFGSAPRVDRFEVFGAAAGKSNDEVILHRVQVVDWTDATDQPYSGRYGGIAPDRARALFDALVSWAEDNHYPDGSLRFELPPPVAEVLRVAADAGRLDEREVRVLKRKLGIDLAGHASGSPLQGSFDTDGGVDVAAVLDGVAFAAGLTAFAIAIAAPVPGSRVAAGLIWASVVAGASASTIRIVSRHQRDVSDLAADTIDALSIISSLLALPGAAAMWKRGASVALREVAVVGAGTKVLRMALVGQITADGLQGMLIAAEGFTSLNKVLADEEKHPVERIEQAIGLIGQLSVTGALIALGARGNVDDLRLLDTDGARANLRRLEDEAAEIDTLDGDTTRGRTGDGPHHGRARVDPPAEAPSGNRRPQLTPEATARLGSYDIDQAVVIRRMLDTDEQSANLLFQRHGLAALDVAREFARVWKRWREIRLPDSMLRVYHKHTGVDGVRYFARQPNTAAGKNEMAAGGWACLREERFHALFPPAGHSVGRHGPQVPDGPGEALELRITTGIAPDGKISFTDRSSRFLSFVDWNNAHDSAYAALRKQFGLSMSQGPIQAKGKSYPIARGYIAVADPVAPGTSLARPLGESYQGIPGTDTEIAIPRSDGGTRRGIVYGKAARVDAAEIVHIHVIIGWTGQEWIIIALYPAKLPGATTLLGFSKQPTPAGTTL